MPFILCWIEHGIILQNEGNDNCPLFFVELNMASFFRMKEMTIALYSLLNWTWHHSSEWRKWQLPFILHWIEHGVILQNEGCYVFLDGKHPLVNLLSVNFFPGFATSCIVDDKIYGNGAKRQSSLLLLHRLHHLARSVYIYIYIYMLYSYYI